MLLDCGCSSRQVQFVDLLDVTVHVTQQYLCCCYNVVGSIQMYPCDCYCLVNLSTLRKAFDRDMCSCFLPVHGGVKPPGFNKTLALFSKQLVSGLPCRLTLSEIEYLDSQHPHGMYACCILMRKTLCRHILYVEHFIP